jgi:TAT (twin-arginine translocation) pathway signal sequence
MTPTVLKPTERFPIDRRTLLKGSVATTAAALAPGVALSESSLVVSAQPTSTASEHVLKVSATMARRLVEIQLRNQLRREGKLPLLSIAKEVRRIKETEDGQKFSEAFGTFAAKYRRAVWDQVLQPRRKVLDDPNWRPRYFSEGVGYAGEIDRILRERFEADKKVIGSIR